MAETELPLMAAGQTRFRNYSQCRNIAWHIGMSILVQKWGNSLAIRLPKPVAVQVGLSQGSWVDLTVDGNTLCVRPVSPPELTLDALLAGVTDENLHEAVEITDGVGMEVW